MRSPRTMSRIVSRAAAPSSKTVSTSCEPAAAGTSASSSRSSSAVAGPSRDASREISRWARRSVSTLDRSDCHINTTTASGLLISWATLATSVPRTASFSPCNASARAFSKSRRRHARRRTRSTNATNESRSSPAATQPSSAPSSIASMTSACVVAMTPRGWPLDCLIARAIASARFPSTSVTSTGGPAPSRAVARAWIASSTAATRTRRRTGGGTVTRDSLPGVDGRAVEPIDQAQLGLDRQAAGLERPETGPGDRRLDPNVLLFVNDFERAVAEGDELPMPVVDALPAPGHGLLDQTPPIARQDPQHQAPQHTLHERPRVSLRDEQHPVVDALGRGDERARARHPHKVLAHGMKRECAEATFRKIRTVGVEPTASPELLLDRVEVDPSNARRRRDEGQPIYDVAVRRHERERACVRFRHDPLDPVPDDAARLHAPES